MAPQSRLVPLWRSLLSALSASSCLAWPSSRLLLSFTELLRRALIYPLFLIATAPVSVLSMRENPGKLLVDCTETSKAAVLDYFATRAGRQNSTMQPSE